jgi:hypothetical protein
MHDEIAVVHQDPLSRIVAFHIGGKLAQLLELLSNLIRDGMSLPWVGNRADDEKVGKRSNFPQIEHR